MKRWTTLALVAVTAGLSVARSDPQWAREIGLDVWNIPADAAATRAAEERRDDLRAERAALARCAAANNGVFVRLIEGEVSLGEAADQLEQINGWRDAWPDVIRRSEPAATTDRDAYAGWAIRWVTAHLEDDPDRLAGVRPRLEREYRDTTGREWADPADAATEE